MCKKTSWGFTRFWWIIIKGISMITLILIGTTCHGPWQMKMVELSGQPGNALTANESYGMTRIFFTDAGFLQVIMLACIVTISALKPWGKRIARQNKATMAKNRIEIVA
jgi:hypothetical protein